MHVSSPKRRTLKLGTFPDEFTTAVMQEKEAETLSCQLEIEKNRLSGVLDPVRTQLCIFCLSSLPVVLQLGLAFCLSLKENEHKKVSRTLITYEDEEDLNARIDLTYDKLDIDNSDGFDFEEFRDGLRAWLGIHLTHDEWEILTDHHKLTNDRDVFDKRMFRDIMKHELERSVCGVIMQASPAIFGCIPVGIRALCMYVRLHTCRFIRRELTNTMMVSGSEEFRSSILQQKLLDTKLSRQLDQIQATLSHCENHELGGRTRNSDGVEGHVQGGQWSSESAIERLQERVDAMATLLSQQALAQAKQHQEQMAAMQSLEEGLARRLRHILSSWGEGGGGSEPAVCCGAAGSKKQQGRGAENALRTGKGGSDQVFSGLAPSPLEDDAWKEEWFLAALADGQASCGAQPVLSARQHRQTDDTGSQPQMTLPTRASVTSGTSDLAVDSHSHIQMREIDWRSAETRKQLKEVIRHVRTKFAAVGGGGGGGGGGPRLAEGGHARELKRDSSRETQLETSRAETSACYVHSPPSWAQNAQALPHSMPRRDISERPDTSGLLQGSSTPNDVILVPAARRKGQA